MPKPKLTESKHNYKFRFKQLIHQKCFSKVPLSLKQKSPFSPCVHKQFNWIYVTHLLCNGQTTSLLLIFIQFETIIKAFYMPQLGDCIMNTIRPRKFGLRALRTTIKIHILKNVKNSFLLLREYLCKLDFSIILFAKHLPACYN